MKFKFISLTELVTSTRQTVSRFPLLTIFLLIGAANHLYMDIFDDKSLKFFSRNLFMSILILIPALYSIQLSFESNWLKKRIKYFFEILSVVLTSLYFYSLPDKQLLTLHFSTFWLYLVISFLLSFITVKDFFRHDNLFWHFNTVLFSRLNITALYTGVIIGGSGAALSAIDALFKTNLMEHQESRIAIVTLWIFLPLFFLSGVPKIKEPDKILSYKPAWLKNISIYVLLPFTTIYLGILYAYFAKIIFLWKLPDGMVSYLVLSFAAFGIASLIIVYPFQKDENSKWSNWFGRLFYFLQFPLLILLSIAIYRRVIEYGITFKRYYVIELAIWLLFITVFMILRKNRNLIVVPLSLFAFALLSSIGPWSACNVSFINQKNRLNDILSQYSLIRNGKLAKPNADMPKKIMGDICSITKYLYDYDKLHVFLNLSNSIDTLTPKNFTEQLGFAYKERWEWDHDSRDWFHFYFANDSFFIDNLDFDYFVKMNANKVQMNGLTVQYKDTAESFVFISPTGPSCTIKLKDVINKFEQETFNKDMNKSGMYSYEDANYKILCIFSNLNGRKKPEGLELNSIDVDFFIKKKN